MIFIRVTSSLISSIVDEMTKYNNIRLRIAFPNKSKIVLVVNVLKLNKAAYLSNLKRHKRMLSRILKKASILNAALVRHLRATAMIIARIIV